MKATINPTPEQSALRSVARIKRLKIAIKGVKDAGKKQGLKAELKRRQGELAEISKAISEAL